MFTPELLKERMGRAHRALIEFDVDAWISVGRETHFTQEPALQFLLPACVLPACALIVTREKSVCLVGTLEAEEMEAYGPFTEVIAYRGDAFEPMLTEAIKRLAPLRRVALNFSEVDPSADGLSLTQYRRLMRCLTAAGFVGELVSSCNIMKRVRGQKSQAEVDGIERTVLAAMKIYDSARGALRSGMSGADIQRYFQQKVHEIGAEFSWPRAGNPFISVGAKSSYLCKRPPEDVFAQPGDLINVDFGLRIGDFASDDQRSFYVLGEGETRAPDEVLSAFHAVQAAIRAAVKASAPGVYATVPRDRANEVFESLGYPKVGGLGHELGTFAHEGGMHIGSEFALNELDQHLEEGMTFTMEPAILTSHGRLCQEEVVAITHDGCRFLSIPQEEVWLIR
jgi:Xaa-Pro aminopeptidase